MRAAAKRAVSRRYAPTIRHTLQLHIHSEKLALANVRAPAQYLSNVISRQDQALIRPADAKIVEVY